MLRCSVTGVTVMVRRGSPSKLKEVENAIINLLATSSARVHGLGFREIHRKLQTHAENSRPGSFSTLKKCLGNLELRHTIHRDPENNKYFVDLLELFAHETKSLIVNTVSEANIFGGGQLFHPKPEELLSQQTKPKEKPKIFVAKCTFVKANLKGTLDFKDEGFLNLETLDGRWSGNSSSPKQGSKWITPETRKRAARHRSPPCLQLVLAQLNAAKTIENWLRTIWQYAKKNHLVKDGLTPEKITDQELERIWQKMFKRVEGIVLAEFISTQTLLKWLKTSEGKNRFAKTIDTKNTAGQTHGHSLTQKK